jgi:hypothetical protein
MIRYPYVPRTRPPIYPPLVREDMVIVDSVPRPLEREIVYRDAGCGPLVFRQRVDQQLQALGWCRESLAMALAQLDRVLRTQPWHR